MKTNTKSISNKIFPFYLITRVLQSFFILKFKKKKNLNNSNYTLKEFYGL